MNGLFNPKVNLQVKSIKVDVLETTDKEPYSKYDIKMKQVKGCSSIFLPRAVYKTTPPIDGWVWAWARVGLNTFNFKIKVRGNYETVFVD